MGPESGRREHSVSVDEWLASPAIRAGAQVGFWPSRPPFPAGLREACQAAARDRPPFYPTVEGEAEGRLRLLPERPALELDPGAAT